MLASKAPNLLFSTYELGSHMQSTAGNATVTDYMKAFLDSAAGGTLYADYYNTLYKDVIAHFAQYFDSGGYSVQNQWGMVKSQFYLGTADDTPRRQWFENTFYVPSGLVQPVVGGGVVPHPSLYPRPPNKQQISRARRRLGLYDGADEEVVAATVIADVAARQALVLERDEQKRFEELLRKLELQGIEFDARYLEALNIQRERLIDAEIAARQRLIREDEEILILLLMAASVA
jgi:hypothetical protein